MRATSRTAHNYATLMLLLVLAATGCRSSSRWASLNPWSHGDQETSIAARSAPELPTDQVANPGGAATAVATAASSSQVAPPFTPAATSVPAYPTTGVASASAPTAYPATAPPATTTPATTAPAYPTTQTYAAAAPAAPAARAATPAAGPYDPNGYTPPVATVAAAPDERYGDSRYTSTNGLPLAQSPASSPLAGAGLPAAAAAPSGRYGEAAPPLPGLPLATTPASAVAASPVAMPAASQVTQTAGQGVPVASSPGGYRPGGTSSYDPQVSVALRSAPAATAPKSSEQTQTPPANAYPTTEAYRY
ncbi:hypothetical protein Pla123a_41080 [Posidoniimonas polymericola]|uniref:Uncharacterized protein n=1 Tax=Posidoniimonas polymericola TaxID=2528002 RepID=A0A5C5YCY4_9BACT|nr:hypothetical protein [Posidoniimonas polymericola]TWT72808.1 hypothetical protein Pla123a_41080 [Posidoniimonas polymericola]